MAASTDDFKRRVRDVLIKQSSDGTTDKASYHAYENFYPDALTYLLDKKEEDLHILEVGTYHGGSMKCWMEIFPRAHFYGIDWDFDIMDLAVRTDTRLKLLKCNQADPQVKTAFEGVQFDLIIDDASHMARDQIATFNMLKDRMASTGKYIIEDIYPDNYYPPEFKDMFEEVDITYIKNRGDDKLFVYQLQ